MEFDIIERVLNQSLLRPDVEQEKIIELSKTENKTFNDLMHTLNAKHKDNQLKIVFRGEKKCLLEKTLFRAEHSDITLGKLLGRLFYFGGKAKNYFENGEPSRQFKNHLKNINDSSDAD